MQQSARAQKRRIADRVVRREGKQGTAVPKSGGKRVANVGFPGGGKAQPVTPASRGGGLVQALRGCLGLSQVEMARLMYVSPRTLQRLERGESPLIDGDAARYHELKSLVEELSQLIGAKDLAGWIKLPLADLKDRSVFETLAAGDSGRIWRMIYYLESGTPG